MQESRPQFSILIPTTGRSRLVQEAVMSVLAQTYQNFEVIVTDTSGNTETRLAALGSGDQRVRYAITPDSDPSLGWNHAATIARGEYLLWLDDDNYLLPFALETFHRAIARTHADLITANHLYYYDKNYPRHFLRDHLGVVPFTGKEYPLDLHKILSSMYSLSKRSGESVSPRLHPAATAVSRRVTERAFAKLGFALIPRMRTNHSLHPIICALAKSGIFLDRPLALVGRYGVSITQTWSTSARSRLKKVPFERIYSPVRGDTRINSIVESYLRAQHLLPEFLGAYAINYDHFAELYLWELFYLDADAATAIKNWRDLFGFLKTLPTASQKRLYPLAWRLALLTPVIYVARRTGLNHFWRVFRAKNMGGTRGQGGPKKIIQKNREYSIPLKSYGIESVSMLVPALRNIMLQKTGRDILFASGQNPLGHAEFTEQKVAKTLA